MSLDNLIKSARQMYDASALQYHSWTHIESMLTTYRTLYGAEPSDDVIAAICFHDVVYVPGAPPGVNEDLSYLTFLRFYHHYDRTPKLNVELIKTIIEHTKIQHHMSDAPPPSEIVARVVDCDLAALGVSNFVYFEYYQRIVASEFEFLGDMLGPTEGAAQMQRQAEFLNQFLNKKKIYHTKEAREMFEGNARKNIKVFHKIAFSKGTK